MARRRMFSQETIISDRFLKLSHSAHTLYLGYSMFADDDGFISSPEATMRLMKCDKKDHDALINSGFIIQFKSGICVITDWRVNNQIKKDRYQETQFINEKQLLNILPNGSYELQIQGGSEMDTNYIQNGSSTEPQYSIGKVSIDKESIEGEETPPVKPKNKYGQFRNVLLDDEEYMVLKEAIHSELEPYIEKLSCYMKSKEKRYKDHCATIMTWWRKDNPQQSPKNEHVKLKGVVEY